MAGSGGGKRRMLLVEDDRGVRAVVAEVCRQQGFEVQQVGTGKDGLEAALADPPDMMILDWVLPDINGTEVLREVRRRGVTCPVIMLTGRSAPVDQVVGLEIGADDYITKPFDSRVLAAKLRAHSRRTTQTSSGRREGLIKIGSVEIDTDGRRVKIGGDEVKLTMTEFNLLALLAANPGRVLKRSQMLEKVWGYLADVDEHSVDPHVQRLRKKLSNHQASGVTLEAVAGLGYRLSSK